MIVKKRFGFLVWAAALFALPVLAQNTSSQEDISDARWAEQSQKITVLQDRLLAKELEYEALIRSDKMDRKELKLLISDMVELKSQIRNEWEKLHPRRGARWAGRLGGWHDYDRAWGGCGCPRGRMGGW